MIYIAKQKKDFVLQNLAFSHSRRVSVAPQAVRIACRIHRKTVRIVAFVKGGLNGLFLPLLLRRCCSFRFGFRISTVLRLSEYRRICFEPFPDSVEQGGKCLDVDNNLLDLIPDRN